MGALRIEIGALNRSISAADNKMTDVLTEVVEATGGPVAGTAAQKADHVLVVIRRYLLDIANGNRRRKDVVAAEQAAEAQKLNLDA